MTNESLVWRRLATSDLDPWISLLHRAYANNLAAGMNFTAATLSHEQGHQLILEHPVNGGFLEDDLMATYTLRTNEEGTHLNFFGVDPTLQGKGIGKEVLDIAEHHAVTLGAKELLLDTPEIHPWLVEFYKRQGYQPYGTTQWESKKYHSVLFRKAFV